MFYFLVIVSLFLCRCTYETPLDNDASHTVVDRNNNQCEYELIEPLKPESPAEAKVNNTQKYSYEVEDCKDLPEVRSDILELETGCYKGCLEVSGYLKISGKGSDKTILICEDAAVEAAISGINVDLEVRNISINSAVKGIDLDGKSSLRVIDTAIYDCRKGGISGCIKGDECTSEFSVKNSLVSDIKKDSENSISYGITIGPGNLQIKNSYLKNFHSFAIAVWDKSNLVLENTAVENVYGETGDFHGVGVYGFNSNVIAEKLSVKDVATSFIYVDAPEKKQKKVELKDTILSGLAERINEQGGLVLEGAIEAQLSRVKIESGRGNGIFGNGIELTATDVRILNINSDRNTASGFGIILFNSNAEFERLGVSGAENAGIYIDGLSEVSMKELFINDIRSDPENGEFGIGLAIQDGVSLAVENGVISRTRECGIMVVNAKLTLSNVEVTDINPRECFENGQCLFADGIPFGHGISLFSDSELSFKDVFINGNANGFNIESSKVNKLGGTVFLTNNKSAVNAWNIVNPLNLEEAFKDVTFCDNQSVFTTDVQPVRDGM